MGRAPRRPLHALSAGGALLANALLDRARGIRALSVARGCACATAAGRGRCLPLPDMQLAELGEGDLAVAVGVRLCKRTRRRARVGRDAGSGKGRLELSARNRTGAIGVVLVEGRAQVTQRGRGQAMAAAPSARARCTRPRERSGARRWQRAWLVCVVQRTARAKGRGASGREARQVRIDESNGHTHGPRGNVLRARAHGARVRRCARGVTHPRGVIGRDGARKP